MRYKRLFKNQGVYIYEVLSETLTHVYLRNIETGYRINVDKWSLKKNYVPVGA
jgi:hypothetical protein